MRIPTAFLALSCLAAATFAQTAGPGLSPAQLKVLKGDKAHSYVVPNYVPSGFRLTKMERDFSATGPEGRYDHLFSLTYKSAKTRGEFTVQMAGGGIGDLILNDEGKGKLKTYLIKAGFAKGVELMFVHGSKPEEFGVNWIDRGEKARLQFVSVYGRGVPLAEARKIASSLQVLR